MIRYKKQNYYKYTLHIDYQLATDIRPPKPVSTNFIDLDGKGLLTIKKNYAWDGPSGPSFDTKNFMRGSLVHDALYQLIREMHLPLEARAAADWLLREICLEDGMSTIRAKWVYMAVDWFGESSARPRPRPSISSDLIQAP